MAGYDDHGPQLYQIDPSGSYFAWKASGERREGGGAGCVLVCMEQHVAASPLAVGAQKSLDCSAHLSQPPRAEGCPCPICPCPCLHPQPLARTW